jgi:hypothetical protein
VALSPQGTRTHPKITQCFGLLLLLRRFAVKPSYRRYLLLHAPVSLARFRAEGRMSEGLRGTALYVESNVNVHTRCATSQLMLRCVTHCPQDFRISKTQILAPPSRLCPVRASCQSSFSERRSMSGQTSSQTTCVETPYFSRAISTPVENLS